MIPWLSILLNKRFLLACLGGSLFVCGFMYGRSCSKKVEIRKEIQEVTREVEVIKEVIVQKDRINRKYRSINDADLGRVLSVTDLDCNAEASMSPVRGSSTAEGRESEPGGNPEGQTEYAKTHAVR